MTKYQYCYFKYECDLLEVRLEVESAIKVRFSERESSYWAGTYFLFDDITSDLRIQLHRNLDDTGQWIVKEFEGALILCSISGPVDIVEEYSSILKRGNGKLITSRTSEVVDE